MRWCATAGNSHRTLVLHTTCSHIHSLVSIARGEQQYFEPNGIPTATEGCKSNALMRCCKDLGIASDLWDPRFIRKYKKEYCEEKFVEHATNKKRRKLWKRKCDTFDYPYKVVTSSFSGN